ncbi:MAG: hypothetical protein QNJ48_02780 [Desulfobacterales bacterium]|nr:hypothetical protein [Desulfobacterales bacterium]MDJ0874398.1 hypothetical protein [Desulfobacterales bacterium]MDJ0883054.1 hypothetical protein [Desulfobacterales bacterium]
MQDEFKQSNFRRKIAEDDFKYSMKKVAAAGVLTFALLFLMNLVPVMAYITYPVAILTSGTNELVANLSILAYLLILSYLLLWFFVFRRQPVPRISHLPCPHCASGVDMFRDWECEKCGKSQGFKKYITEGCRQCGKMSDTYSCEHCNQPFAL